MKPKSVYKIRDTKTGLYSKGGNEPKWSRNGKTWSRLGDLKGHLTLVRDGLEYPKPDGDERLRRFYGTSVIEEFVVTTVVTNVTKVL